MKIADLKQSFDSVIQPAPLQFGMECEQAWDHFKKFLQQFPDGENCEEFGISFCKTEKSEGQGHSAEPELFEVYFGRLIDAEKGAGWCTAEIDFYYRFEMNEMLLKMSAELSREGAETAFCLTEGQHAISQKRLEVLDFADSQRKIWQEIQRLKPIQASYHFWIW